MIKKVFYDNLPFMIKHFNYKNIKKHKKLPSLRVIAGRIKGTRIECPPGEIRPMTSMVREALFNILMDCTDFDVLDLFCGSGAISIEAFSRGAKSSNLVELDKGKREVILKNLEHAKFTGATLFTADVISFCNQAKNRYDLIVIDPPYLWDRKEELIKVIAEKRLLKDDGTLVMQLPKKDKLSDDIGDLTCYDIRKYGLNALHFFTYRESIFS